ncbi:hypothetical protein [Okeania sp. SIO2B3]|nr:hypothetical protein [Okeania sp. SIO2B3]
MNSQIFWVSCEKLADYLLVETGVVLLLGIAAGKFGVVKFSGLEM